jgi:hypothetical protein
MAAPGRTGQSGIVTLTCSQPRDASDEWMEYLASATGGRAFSGGKVSGTEERDVQAGTRTSTYQFQRDDALISEALHFAVEDSRYVYQIGFYVPESELDGKVHNLSVTVPARPKLGLRYRSGYTASASATAPPAGQEPTSPLHPDEVGIDATAARVKSELRVSLALAPETVANTADGGIVLEATFTQTDDSGKQLAKVQESVRVPSPGSRTEMVRYGRVLKAVHGAVLLHIRIRDEATNRVGSIAIPIGR